jgi:hypothetical protein
MVLEALSLLLTLRPRKRSAGNFHSLPLLGMRRQKKSWKKSERKHEGVMLNAFASKQPRQILAGTWLGDQ